MTKSKHTKVRIVTIAMALMMAMGSVNAFAKVKNYDLTVPRTYDGPSIYTTASSSASGSTPYVYQLYTSEYSTKYFLAVKQSNSKKQVTNSVTISTGKEQKYLSYNSGYGGASDESQYYLGASSAYTGNHSAYRIQGQWLA